MNVRSRRMIPAGSVVNRQRSNKTSHQEVSTVRLVIHGFHESLHALLENHGFAAANVG
jgi:hypothetical protein